MIIGGGGSDDVVGERGKGFSPLVSCKIQENPSLLSPTTLSLHLPPISHNVIWGFWVSIAMKSTLECSPEYLTLINNLGCKWVLHVNIKINCCSFSTSGLGYREQCTVHRHTDVHKNTSAPRHVSLHKQKDSHEVNN